MAGTYELPAVGGPNTTEDPKVLAFIKGRNEKYDSSNLIPGSGLSTKAEITAEQLAASGKPFDWYTPKIIATEETRENVAFGTLTTKDEITEVVLPTNGLIAIGYMAIVKKSSASAEAGRAAIFLGANQLKVSSTSAAPIVQEAANLAGTESFATLGTIGRGLRFASEGVGTSVVTTGQVLGQGEEGGSGFCYVFAAAGTYTVSVQYRATAGKITAKERKLWVGVLGV